MVPLSRSSQPSAQHTVGTHRICCERTNVVRGLKGCSVEFACHPGDHMLNVLVNSLLFLLTGLQRSRAGLHARAIFPLGAAACLPWQPMKGTHY